MHNVAPDSSKGYNAFDYNNANERSIRMASGKYVAYIGTYPKKKSKGIFICDVNVKEGSLTIRREEPIEHPSVLFAFPEKNLLYCNTNKGVAVFQIGEDGDLTRLQVASIDAMRPRSLSTNSTGKLLFTGGYHDAKITVHKLGSTGKIGALTGEAYHEGFGTVAERTYTPHITCVVPTPDDKYLCSVDNGTDRVNLYRIEKNGSIEQNGTLHCHPGSGPRALVFGNGNKNAYIISNISNTVSVYDYTPGKEVTAPSFKLIQTVPTASDDVDTAHDMAAAIRFSPDGKYLFASTAGDNTATLFSVQADGTLERLLSLPVSGAYPKDIAFLPGGKNIAVACNESNIVNTFRIDFEKNIFVQKGRPLFINDPSCIEIIKLK